MSTALSLCIIRKTKIWQWIYFNINRQCLGLKLVILRIGKEHGRKSLPVVYIITLFIDFIAEHLYTIVGVDYWTNYFTFYLKLHYYNFIILLSM